MAMLSLPQCRKEAEQAGAMPDSKDVWERIIVAARDSFSVNGFRGAQIESIARDAGVGKQSVYYYFQSKEYLYRETIRFFAGNLIDALIDTDFDAFTPVEAIRRFYGMIYDFYVDFPDQANIAVDFYLLDDHIEKNGSMVRRVFKVFEDILDRAIVNRQLLPGIDKVQYFSFASCLVCGCFIDPFRAWGLEDTSGHGRKGAPDHREQVLNAIENMIGLRMAAQTG